MLIIDQKGYSQDYIWQSGTHKITIDKTNGNFVWVLFRIGLEQGIEKAKEAQQTVAITDVGNKVWSPQHYDKAQYHKLHDQYLNEAINNLQTSEKVFGFAWRVYGSSYKVKSGRWNPINSLVQE